MQNLRVVGFESLWKMAIDTPYSLLVSNDESAWTCGQLAMSETAQVIAPNDLGRQCEIVADYITEILRRADVPVGDVRRLVQYYVPSDAAAEASMRSVFRERFGNTVLLDPVPVPGFYYDGVMLEVDAFCGAPTQPLERLATASGEIQFLAGTQETWISLASTIEDLAEMIRTVRDLLAACGFNADNVLSEHWLAPTPTLQTAAAEITSIGQGFDPGAVLDAGPNDGPVRAKLRLVAGNDVWARLQDIEGARVVIRRVGGNAWVQSRAIDAGLDLVSQTKTAMRAMSIALEQLGWSFEDVVKQTAHYVGGTADELHDNMNVRNGYYKKPGPASTGIPVHGVAAAGIRNVVDLTLCRGWRA